MFLTEEISKKWEPILEHPSLPKIQDSYKKSVITRLLENQEGFLREASNETTNIQNYDPVVISLVRRVMPNIIAFDVTGVQPMTGPTGLIFAMRSLYGAPDATNWNGGDPAVILANQEAGRAPNEAFMDEPNTAYTGPRSTNAAEDQGGPAPADAYRDMSFTIEKTTVTAKARALKAEYTLELAQDLKAIHGLDAESELSNILSTEIMNEINREIIQTIYVAAKLAKQETSYTNGTPDAVPAVAAGSWDMSKNSDGRWSAEKYKSLLVKINKESNAIAKDTRRGRGNFIICSSDVASVLDLTGKMSYTPEMVSNLNVDDTGNCFVGTLNGRYKVFIDPYAMSDFLVVGYKGTSSYDAGLYYAPYVPLQMVKAISPTTFAPSFGFKIRYGLVSNPFTSIAGGKNIYFRKFSILNL